MEISKNQFILNKKRVKRRIKRKKESAERCNHCSGAFKGFDELECCLMCGREKGHICNNCLFDSQGKFIKKFA